MIVMTMPAVFIYERELAFLNLKEDAIKHILF